MNETEKREGTGYRALLWVVLAVSLAANGVSSTAGASPLISVPLGVIALTCVVLLIVHHRKHRRA
jgi:Flp pilus assembly protein TadB